VRCAGYSAGLVLFITHVHKSGVNSFHRASVKCIGLMLRSLEVPFRTFSGFTELLMPILGHGLDIFLPHCL
jgi:hypothetical protein